MSNLTTVPTLRELLEHPERVSALPLEAIPGLRGKLAELDTMLRMRVAMAQSNGQGQAQGGGDRLLGVKEAAAKLGTTEDWLYRHDKLPFVVRLGKKQVRYSEAGIDRYIRSRAGR